VLLALYDATTRPLYFSFVKSETNDDYALAISTINVNGYTIKGVVIDGWKGLIPLLSEYRIQICQFHMTQIIIRYLTKNPHIKASIALLLLVDRLPRMGRTDFDKEHQQRKMDYDAMQRKLSTSKVTGKTHYTHPKLRGAMKSKSIDFFLPYLFTYQLSECEVLPDTNNKIKRIFFGFEEELEQA